MRKTAEPSNTIAAALLYIRVSGREQEREGLSLPAQLADCQRLASAQARRRVGWVCFTTSRYAPP